MQKLIGQVADIVEEYRSNREQIGLDYNDRNSNHRKEIQICFLNRVD